MQHLPHTTCPDPFHTGGFGLEIAHQLGEGWSALSYECRTCGFQTMSRAVETWLDHVKVTCPGCDAIRLDWNDAPELCSDCRTREVRVVWVALEPNDLLDRIFPDYPNLNWPWGRVIEAMS